MVVTYTVIGRYAYHDVWVVDEEPNFWDIDPFDCDNSPSDCLWIVPGTLD
jgi:hypothetical protein